MAFFRPPEATFRLLLRKVNGLTSVACAGTQCGYRAVECQKTTEPLVVVEKVRQPLRDNEVRIRTKYCGLNFATALACKGRYQVRPPLPFIPGSEAGGSVVEVGPAVKGLQVGDQVLSILNVGGLAEELVVDTLKPEAALYKLPAGVSCEKAVATVVNYSTAWLAITRKAAIKSGETVLVVGAAGGFGLAAVDLLANVFNAKVTGACGGPSKCELVTSYGTVGALDYLSPNYKEALKQAAAKQKGFDVIIDAIGSSGQATTDLLKGLAFEGRYVTIGYASGEIPQIAANLLLLKSAGAHGLWWGNYLERDRATFDASIQAVLKLLEEGKVRPHVSATYPLEQTNAALQALESRQTTGKVLVQM